MDAVQFSLSGENAFFKKPDVNTYYYFTYGQIHKVALMGMFGAILGYNGYGQKTWTKTKKGQDLMEEYPEFYEKLKGIKVSIVPRNERGYIPKKVQFYNNSVGYASEEQGGNLIVKEQWLENPMWDVYVMLQDRVSEQLAKYLEEKRCVYIPYLGKNDHMANIKNVRKVALVEKQNYEGSISSLYLKKNGTLGEVDDEDDIEVFKYEEKLPIRLNKFTNLYEYETFVYTNLPVTVKQGEIYQAENRILEFY